MSHNDDTGAANIAVQGAEETETQFATYRGMAANFQSTGPVLYGFSKGAKFYGVNILSGDE